MKKIVVKKKKLVAMVLVLLISLLGVMIPKNAEAKEEGKNDQAETITGFTYQLSFPDNQMEKDLGYYKLKMMPGQKQTVDFELSNPGAEKVVVGVHINGAKTNQNGVIEYGDSTIKNDPSLKFDFKELVDSPKSVELAPGETKKVEVNITMPDTTYDGVIAGGIQLMKEEQNGPEASGGGSQVINQYAYVIAFLLQESQIELKPDLKLNQVYAGQNNYRNTIFAGFSNVIATYLNEMSVETQITKKGSNTVLYERKQTAMRMAPNSFIEFPISMNGEKMVNGDYTAKILVSSGEQKWEWSEDFKISKEEADKFNERDVGLVQEKGLDWKLVGLLSGGIVLIVGLVFVTIRLIRNHKRKKEQAKKRARIKAKKKTMKK